MNKSFEIYKQINLKKHKADEKFLIFLTDLFREWGKSSDECFQIELDIFEFKDTDIDLKSVDELAQSIIGECKVCTWIDNFTGRKILKVRKKKKKIVDKIIFPKKINVE